MTIKTRENQSINTLKNNINLPFAAHSLNCNILQHAILSSACYTPHIKLGIPLDSIAIYGGSSIMRPDNGGSSPGYTFLTVSHTTDQGSDSPKSPAARSKPI